ncbi:MAG: hypothetical protein L6U99_09265 [Clostridium sp.]|nr:MAG: hypothetical protein L6U99_09265 [Clostridium sp.]
MKKRYIFLLAFVAMITLAGCKKDSKFSVDEIGTNIDLADTWMKQVSYSDTAINEFDEKERSLCCLYSYRHYIKLKSKCNRCRK